jgi:hypothetical protein
MDEVSAPALPLLQDGGFNHDGDDGCSIEPQEPREPVAEVARHG